MKVYLVYLQFYWDCPGLLEAFITEELAERYVEEQMKENTYNGRDRYKIEEIDVRVK